MVLLLGLAAGCGGADSGPGGGDQTAATASTAGDSPGPQAPPKTLTAAQLTSAVLADGELSGYQVSAMPSGGNRTSTANPAACQPVENARIASLRPAPVAAVGRLFVSTVGQSQGTATTVLIAAYDINDAQQLLAKIRTAVHDCAAGYAGGALKFTAVAAVTAPKVGDEMVSYQLTGVGTQPSWFTIVRIGATVVLFDAASLKPGAGKVPDDLTVAQISKLQKLAG
jgi:hypothetical protein